MKPGEWLKISKTDLADMQKVVKLVPGSEEGYLYPKTWTKEHAKHIIDLIKQTGSTET